MITTGVRVTVRSVDDGWVCYSLQNRPLVWHLIREDAVILDMQDENPMKVIDVLRFLYEGDSPYNLCYDSVAYRKSIEEVSPK